MIRWREVNVFVLSVIASVVSRCFSAFCRRAPTATKKAGCYGTKAAGFRRPVAAFLRVPRAPSVGQACPSARVSPRCRRLVPSFRAVCRSGSCLLRGGAPPSSGPVRSPPRKTPRLHREKVQAGCVWQWAQACRRSEASVPWVRSKRAVGQKRGPRPPGPPCPPPGGGMTGRNLPPGRPSGPRPSGGSGILAPPKRLSR